MPPPAATKKPAVLPRQKKLDIYNSTSTGHQVGTGVSKPASWHKSRSSKLQQQFRNHSLSLSTIVNSTAVASVSVAATTLVSPERCKGKSNQEGNHEEASVAAPSTTQDGASDPPRQQDPTNKGASTSTSTLTGTKIFANCTIYVNGTTAPAISDLFLKRHLCDHGASIATMLARKSVTHVILGKPSSAGGAGGGLAAGKLQKELTKNGRPIKFVSVQWALDSIKAGKRLSESGYMVLDMHSQSQRSIKTFTETSLKVTTNTGNSLSSKGKGRNLENSTVSNSLGESSESGKN